MQAVCEIRLKWLLIFFKKKSPSQVITCLYLTLKSSSPDSDAASAAEENEGGGGFDGDWVRVIGEMLVRDLSQNNFRLLSESTKALKNH